MRLAEIIIWSGVGIGLTLTGTLAWLIWQELHDTRHSEDAQDRSVPDWEYNT